jgi:hypothetical protein
MGRHFEQALLCLSASGCQLAGRGISVCSSIQPSPARNSRAKGRKKRSAAREPRGRLRMAAVDHRISSTPVASASAVHGPGRLLASGRGDSATSPSRLQKTRRDMRIGREFLPVQGRCD